MRQLVFIHGRAQENKDSIALKREWLASFQEGLGKSNLTVPIGEEAIRFPYYGQTLYDLCKGVPADKAAEVIVRGTEVDAQEKDFAERVINEMAEQRGITPEQIAAIMGQTVVERGFMNWEWVQGVLQAIDRHIPFGSGGSIALFTNDVYQYLHKKTIRDTIEDGVRTAMKPGVPTVVVSHSLGTVVAYNLLRREGKPQGWVVPLFITLGSPLAVTAIKQALGQLSPNKHPECVGKWFNAMDDGDVVALYPLSKKHFGITPEIENKTDVVNQTENQHGISGYLNDQEVARRIHDALRE